MAPEKAPFWTMYLIKVSATGESSSTASPAAVRFDSSELVNVSGTRPSPRHGLAPALGIGHPRQRLQMHVRHHAHAGRYGIEQAPQQLGAITIEVRPKRFLGPPRRLGDGREMQEERPVGHIGLGHEIADPIQDDGPLGHENDLLVIGAQRTDREAGTRRQPAQSDG